MSIRRQPGWGGHAYVAGGAVRSRRIFGQYPFDYDEVISSPSRRGRVLPTMSWESLWHAISQCCGVEDEVMTRVLPGKGNFECDPAHPGCGLLSRDDLFRPVFRKQLLLFPNGQVQVFVNKQQRRCGTNAPSAVGRCIGVPFVSVCGLFLLAE